MLKKLIRKWKKSFAENKVSQIFESNFVLFGYMSVYGKCLCRADLNFSTQKVANFFRLAVCKFSRRTRAFDAPGAINTVARTPWVNTYFNRQVGIYLHNITVSKLLDFIVLSNYLTALRATVFSSWPALSQFEGV